MDILVVGAGAREHSLAWQFIHSGHTVWIVPENAGLPLHSVDININDIEQIISFAQTKKIDLVVVGSEEPLLLGIVDVMKKAGLCVFGPNKEAAQIEGSKAWAKAFCHRHDIKTAPFIVCTTMKEARDAIDYFDCSVVIKADGVARGKGVFVCDNKDDALHQAFLMLEKKQFGQASMRIVIEKRIFGKELSALMIVDGERYQMLPLVEDYKTIEEQDNGKNTGGMGAVSTPQWVNQSMSTAIETTILSRTIEGLVKDGIHYQGIIYAGLMLDKDNQPWLLEYNCRFGDPECQTMMVRCQDDLAQWLQTAAQGALCQKTIRWSDEMAVSIVLASKGYPDDYESGYVISGFEQIDSACVFHAGTKRQGDCIVTAGGRVMTITALGKTTEEAKKHAYDAVEMIDFNDVYYRNDIATR